MEWFKWFRRRKTSGSIQEIQLRSLNSTIRKTEVANRVIEMMQGLKVERRINSEGEHSPERRLASL